MRNKIHPFAQAQLDKMLAKANEITSRGSRFGNVSSSRDFGSNQERMKVVSERDHIYNSHLKVLKDTNNLELQPGKAKRFRSWLEEMHPEVFSACDIDQTDETVTFSLGNQK